MYTDIELLKNDLNNQKQIAFFLKDMPKRKNEYHKCLKRIARLKQTLLEKQ